MSNWAAGSLEPKVPDRKSFLYELMILSLLYDEILVQDQVFVCSNKLAKWFASDNRLLSEMFDLGTLKILKHPISAYPADLQDKAKEFPILARSEYVQKHSSNVAVPFQPMPIHKRFHLSLEACLASPERRSAQRECGENTPGLDILGTFRSILRHMLTDANYRRWTRSAFGVISSEAADEFVGFIEEPQRAVDRIKRKERTPKYIPGNVAFNTSLAAQVAGTFPEEKALTKLVHTAFCAVFAKRERARGHFGSTVCELPLIPGDRQVAERSRSREKLVAVQSVIKTPVGLPDPGPGFAEVIRTVRDTSAGRRLRESMRKLGADTDFRSQRECWEEVSGLIAAQAHKTRRFQLSTVIAEVLGSVFAGTILEAFSRGPAHFQLTRELEGTGLHLAGHSLWLAGAYINELRCCYLDSDSMHSALERALTNRVVEIRLPPIALA